MDPETGRIKLGWELIAGGTAGGCQVVCADKITLRNCTDSSRSSQTPWKLCTLLYTSPGLPLTHPCLGKFGYRSKVKLPRWRVLSQRVLCTSFGSWVLSACIEEQAHACFVISHFPQFTSRPIHISRRMFSKRVTTANNSDSLRHSAQLPSREFLCKTVLVVLIEKFLQRYASSLLDDSSRSLLVFLILNFTNRLVDVVKTRLQVEARKGESHYKGLTDAFVKICELDTP